MVSHHQIYLDSHRVLIGDFADWISAIAHDDEEAFQSFRVVEWTLHGAALVPILEGIPQGGRHDGNMRWPQRQILVALIKRMTLLRSMRFDVSFEQTRTPAENWDDVLAANHRGHLNCERSIGDGWADLLTSVVDLLDADGVLPRFGQIKEKFGQLRMYSDGDDTLASPIVEAAEYLSGFVCDVCGRPGRVRNGSWLVTRCDPHLNTRFS